MIDFHPRGLLEAQSYKTLFSHIQKVVLPDREAAAIDEEKRNKEATAKNPNARTNHHHANFLKRWWLLSWPREDMVSDIQNRSRYIVCGQVTLRPIFEFISPAISPNAALIVFPYEDDYSFGVLQSSIHWAWFVNRCSTLTGRYRYTSNTVFDSFPWPQAPTLQAVTKIAGAAIELRALRRELKQQHDLSFRELYRALELPGASPLKDAHEKLDRAVRDAYGMKKSDDPLVFLLDLNQAVANREDAGEAVARPGLPPVVKDMSKLVTDDCISMPQGVIEPGAVALAEGP